MMRDAEKTIGNMADKAGNCFISYVDGEGFPVTKAEAKAEGGDQDLLVFHQHFEI